MITTTTYNQGDLQPGKCSCCNEELPIVRGDGRCPDCIEDEKFFNATTGGCAEEEDEDDPEAEPYTCPDCDGTGKESGGWPCEYCNGRGEI